MLFAVIYIGVLLLVIGFGVFEVGSRNSDKRENDVFDEISAYIGLAMFWPVALGCFLIYLPFCGIYKLGKRARGIRK